MCLYLAKLHLRFASYCICYAALWMSKARRRSSCYCGQQDHPLQHTGLEMMPTRGLYRTINIPVTYCTPGFLKYLWWLSIPLFPFLLLGVGRLRRSTLNLPSVLYSTTSTCIVCSVLALYFRRRCRTARCHGHDQGISHGLSNLAVRIIQDVQYVSPSCDPWVR